MNANAPHSAPSDIIFESHTRAGVRPSSFASTFARPVTRHAGLRLWLIGLGAALGLACSDNRSPPGAAELPGREIEQEPVGQVAECFDGALEPCNELLGEHAGIISCYEGTRTCSGGRFGACGDGHEFELSAAEMGGPSASPGLRPLAFSAPSNCLNNPCNSYCREFNEAPSLGIAPDVDMTAPPLSTWAAGDLASYPPETVVIANREPCQTGADCQFNTACVDPSLGSCGHSVCVDGAALAPGCGRCTDVVCALDADCCGTPVECAHDPCEVGSGQPLEPACDTCVEAICTLHPECCGVTWNAACVGYVATECAPLGQSCGCPDRGVENSGTCYLAGDRPRDFGLSRDACSTYGSSWGLVEVADGAENDLIRDLIASNGLAASWLGSIEIGTDTWSWVSTGDVFFISDATGGSLQNGYTYENWADAEPELGVVGRGLAMGGNGEWRDEQQDAELDYLCEGPPSRLGPKQTTLEWDSGCVELAETACGVECSDQVPFGLGACTARIATNLDDDCADFDVAVGAPCEDAGVARVPVCNHGQTEAPAGLRLIHLPVDQVGRAVLDLSDAVDCTLAEPIPPGRCVNVDGCPGLVRGRALLVNPEDGSENTGECLLSDNWAIYEPVSCGSPICEAGVHDANQVVNNECSIAIENPLGIDTVAAQVTLASVVNVPHCNPGEVLWGNSCYYFERLPETWDSARDRCRDRGMDLVALNSPAENIWVRSQTNPGLDVQIGFNDVVTEGDHEWSNNTCRTYVNWDTAPSQPDNVPFGSEQCTRMTATSADRWEDKACNDGQHPYVCEGPVLDAQGACATGQIVGPDGACYAYDPTPVSWAQAETACLGLGTGWSMVRIDQQNINEFVTGLGNCTSIWLANPPGLFDNFELPSVVALGDTPFIDALGSWQTGVDPTPRATLCRGPSAVQALNPLIQVADLASCGSDSDYYFSGSSVAPENVTLCPLTCDRLRAERGGRIDVEIPCLPPPQPALETVVEDLYYAADCADGGVIWDFLYYDAVTPADSRIAFQVRTAQSVALLEAGGIPFQPVAVAQAVPVDTQRCEIDPPNCPVDLFTALGAPANTQQVLELSVRLLPGSSGEAPLLRDWRVRYSCPPAQ